MKYAIFSGHVTKDTEIITRKIGDTDVPVANFNVAVNTRTSRKDENGKTIELTDYFRVSLWREQAKAMAPYLTKGREVTIQGDFKLETWLDQNNQVHPIMHFTSPTIQLHGANKKAAQPAEPETVIEEDDPDELPFD